jgi:Fe-S-cluster containining protein
VPIFDERQRCTACCRWPGEGRVTEAEISRLPKWLAIPELEFIQRFTRLKPDRRGLALQEKPNGECVFLGGMNCAVQPVKPQQCDDFPNLCPGFKQVCRAVPRVVSQAEYARRIKAATGREEKGQHGRTLPAAD